MAYRRKASNQKSNWRSRPGTSGRGYARGQYQSRSNKVSRGNRSGTSWRGNGRARSQSNWKDERLFNAAEKGDLDILRKLKREECLKRKLKTRWTLLHYAAHGNQADAAQMLLRKINPNEINAWNQTAAHLAALKGNTEVLEVLLSDPRLNKDKRDKWKCKYNDWLATHLYEAVEAQDKQYILKLLQLNANPDYVARKLYDGWPTKDRLPKNARKLAKELNNNTLSLFQKRTNGNQRSGQTKMSNTTSGDEDPDGSHDGVDPGDSSDGSHDGDDPGDSEDGDSSDGSHDGDDPGDSEDGDGSDGSHDSDDPGDSDDNDSSSYALNAPLKMEVIPATEMKEGPHVYKMDTVPRGYVSIINYNTFDNMPSLTRNGSEQDVTNLKNLFTQMGYSVNPQLDLTEDETMFYLRSLRNNPVLESVGCLVLFIMSHGIGRDTFYTKDMNLVTAKKIRSLFYDNECPKLKGKPKLFFFHFCRGNYLEQKESPKAKKRLRPEKPEIQTESVLKKVPPRDIWCAYSTTEDFYAIRHVDFGSPFSVAWCRTLAQHAHNNDLGKLETLFGDISKKTPHTTVPEITKFDFKEFYFNPTKILFNKYNK